MPIKQRRSFTHEFKLQILEEIIAVGSVSQAARDHQLHAIIIDRWQKQQCQCVDGTSLATGAFILMKAATWNLNTWMGS